MYGARVLVKATPMDGERKTETPAQRLEWLRIALKIKLKKDFARKLGITPDQYSHYLSSKYGPPHWFVTEALLPITGADSNYVYHGDMRGLPHGLALDIMAAKAKTGRGAR